MRYPGRFDEEWKSTLSAAIIALRACTFLLENPCAPHPLPAWFWNRLTLVRRFDFSSCWTNWPEQALDQRIDVELRRIKILDELGMYTW